MVEVNVGLLLHPLIVEAHEHSAVAQQHEKHALIDPKDLVDLELEVVQLKRDVFRQGNGLKQGLSLQVEAQYPVCFVF